MDYAFGNKAQWRRWLWNRIAERTVDTRNSLVLLLAGEDALDIEVARRHGFQPRNMIAVERDASTLKKLRDCGVLTINGNLGEVLMTWPVGRQVSVVVGDFCCGLERKLCQQVVTAMFRNHAFWRSVLAMNFMRGRDSSTTDWRATLQQGGPGILGDGRPEHRGEMFAGLLLGLYFDSEEATALQQQVVAEAIWKAAKPACYSYRSKAGSQHFDSTVLSHPIGALELLHREDFKEARQVSARIDMGTGSKQRRRTAAVLAHHTRRAAA